MVHSIFICLDLAFYFPSAPLHHCFRFLSVRGSLSQFRYRSNQRARASDLQPNTTETRPNCATVSSVYRYIPKFMLVLRTGSQKPSFFEIMSLAARNASIISRTFNVACMSLRAQPRLGHPSYALEQEISIQRWTWSA